MVTSIGILGFLVLLYSYSQKDLKRLRFFAVVSSGLLLLYSFFRQDMVFIALNATIIAINFAKHEKESL